MKLAMEPAYEAAIAAGGTDNWAARLLRCPPTKSAGYGAYVLTADGLNLEAVCHLPG
jgi:hypothetical protein